MVQSQSTLTGRTVPFWAHTSLQQPQANALFSRTPVNQTFFDRHKGHGGPRPVLHYQISVTIIMEYFVKHIINELILCNGKLRQSFNQISKVMDQYLLHTCAAI